MGSVKHPRLFDVATIESVRAAFHEVYATVREQNVACHDEDELKAHIIRQLLELASDGTLPPDSKEKVLRSMPLDAR